MKTYEWILFDADDTLFHFDALSGLQRMFSRLGVRFTQQDYAAYQVVNKSLWALYQKGEITAQRLKQARFQAWADRLQVLPEQLNSAFLAAMAEICKPLDGAANLLSALKGKTKLGIITNGLTEFQQARLERAGFQDYFDCLVVSEEVGIAKPHPGIFDYALSRMGNPMREQVLMVGDNPESDIQGGMNAGLDTCWLNVDKKPLPAGIKPKYQISALRELETLLLTKEHSFITN